MRATLGAAGLLAFLLALGSPGRADEQGSGPEEAAAEVEEAHEAGRAEVVARLAAREAPDPWLVADALLARGAAEAAAAFARASARPDVAGLAAFVDARRRAPREPQERERLAALEAAAGREALALAEAFGEPSDAGVRARVARRRGVVLRALGRDEEAVGALRTAAEQAEGVGWLALASHSLRDAGRAAFAADDYEAAQDLWARRADLDARRGAEADRAEALRDLALAHHAIGTYAHALADLDEARALHGRSGKTADVADDLDLTACVYLEMGDAAQALLCQEQAVAAAGDEAPPARRAALLRRLGTIHAALRHEDEGLAILGDALATSKEHEDADGVGAALADMGDVHLGLGEHDRALACYQESLAACRAAGGDLGTARALDGLGRVHCARGDARAALPCQEQALAIYEKVDARREAIAALASMALTRFYLGDASGAQALYERAQREAERVRIRDLLVNTLWESAEAHLLAGEREEAAARARRAVTGLPDVLGGLSEEQGAAARARHAGVFEVGATAGLELGDDDLLCFFLESGRAGTLLEFLGRREALQATLASPALLDAEARARGREAEALDAYRKVKDRGGRHAIRRARADLDAARHELKSVIEQIQREAKAKAGVLTVQPASLASIRGWVGEGEVLVVYGIFRKIALALVIRPDAVRAVRLGDPAQIQRAFKGFLLDDPDADPSAELATVRKLVVEPLGLTPADRRVLVSPDGILAYVPFAPLLDGRELAYVPSGTTYGLLLADRARRGEGVLAVGDPVYDTNEDPCLTASTRSGVDLLPLPYTREEALAVGTVVLLGSDATEAGFRYSVSRRPRWSAVHVACHGVMDPDYPTLSALALTTEGHDDGFLTALDVFRLKVPSDLVVLSACDSGVGKIVNAEGVLGLMRAFLFAGSPRVIVSLGRVDDEATRVLMEELYRHWKAGEPAARALRLAQEAVRSDERWAHPYYWANWVLWGLPD